MIDDGTAPHSGRPGEPDSRGGQLCAPFLERLPITGLSMTVLGESGNESTIHATDETSARIEELQFELGEGPHWQALRSGKPAMVPDVLAGETLAWPMFGAAVRELGVGAIFAFPMVMGAITVGVVDLYRTGSGPLTPSAIKAARGLAWSAAEPALRVAAQSADSEMPFAIDEAPELRREVHQATGIVLVQLGTSATEAFIRIRAHAFSTGRSVEDVARDVVARTVDFSQVVE